MAPDIDSPTSEERGLALKWSNRLSLTPRILAVNIFALALLAGGFSYLDSYRARIVESRMAQSSREVRLIAQSLAAAAKDPPRRDTLVLSLARDMGVRIRLFGEDGKLLSDSRDLGLHNVVLRDPDKDPWNQDVARFLDAVIDTVAGADRAPQYRERPPDRGFDWPDVRSAGTDHGAPSTVWRAPDRTPVITAAAPITGLGVVMTTVNARDITTTVRTERLRLGVVLLIVMLASIGLSLFLARTIVRPLRHLADAAIRVRLGRAREVVVPRLPSRMDEIGRLARAISDMSQALRARIDATESFAADLAHELKNPLASLRSAVEGLGHVRKREHRDQLLAIVREDVLRLDRLITDISDASRLDAQLSRAKFEPVDIGEMIAALIAQREERGVPNGIRLSFDRASRARMRVLGEGGRLERVFENLIDNAVSFSPKGGRIALSAAREGRMLVVQVEDEGPGVPEDEREAVFRRFHSVRPEGEAFGRHSGLGLAIARTIVEAHQGSIAVEARADGMSGARFVIRLPIAEKNG
ncbi:sensor histidine kinase [Sphingomonas canadensis]|uniref:histidine kinase n=1 Tax=Sphingomonas canadensis TaxID=1219257 RepID=A0ABW3HCB3_9SPHN|nr:sensor histidine kinase [Sphingomonas canadensis]MCW3836729.1 sensor histidine kinase [Sphingomonas canadensis]